MTKARVLLVSGWRRMREPRRLIEVFDEFLPDLVIHGGARGCDLLADNIARARGLGIAIHPYITKLGDAGGPKRNEQMVYQAKLYLDAGHDVLVACFPGPGSRGTWSTFHLAKGSLVPVVMREVRA